ncbi:hypothetical protein [Acinetobacter proteolyticus]|uniref:Uncharacterized protein n=1 Tax=Acinetobacter proteolyticus TaxID=1776741 RepID=A0A2N0WI67_9GAMM|nr:hypothetical protein [Acinetobacter proteolyticus]PKF35499.1 hypothetical protein CW311_04210 [Acinetobacter proteolyticus]
MTTIANLTREIEANGLKKTTEAYSNKLTALTQGAKSVQGDKRIGVYDEYVKVIEKLNLLVVVQGGPSTEPVTFEYFYGLPEQRKLL